MSEKLHLPYIPPSDLLAAFVGRRGSRT